MKFSKSGFTLMELLVYMAIVGIIVVIAGEAFSNSTKFRIRTDNMIRATQEAENVGMLLREDVAQMGAKSSLDANVADANDLFNASHISEVYLDPNNAVDDNKDSSSFRLVYASAAATAKLDSLVFRRMRYSDAGVFQAVEEVSWFSQVVGGDTILKRQCVIISKASTSVADAPCAPQGTNGSGMSEYAVLMATGVTDFRVLPALPLIRSNATTLEYRKEQIFPPGDGDQFKFFSRYAEGNFTQIDVSAGGNSVTLSGFHTNYNMATGTVLNTEKTSQQVIALANTDEVSDSWSALCSNEGNYFTFYPHEEYEISFRIPYDQTGSDGSPAKMQMFVPGRDHMQVGFINLSGQRPAGMDDFMFYPPSATDANNKDRVMRFTVPDTVKKVCLAFTFAIYSPVVANGTLTISNLRVKRISSSNYKFDESIHNVPIKDKKNVKALRLILAVKRGVKNGGSGETGNVDVVIPIPSNGPRD
ncbi:MAG: type II secretion system protein [Fibrobacter sp.]|jgi:prepilin-type N-terminal cleavage/methylation domain-containing protein|nr:type II secretion system protein [Fibrobacter sp.]